MCRTITPQIWLVPVLHTPAISYDWWRGQGREESQHMCICRRYGTVGTVGMPHFLVTYQSVIFTISYIALTENKNKINRYFCRKNFTEIIPPTCMHLTGWMWMSTTMYWAWILWKRAINPWNRRDVLLPTEGRWQFVQHSVLQYACVKRQHLFYFSLVF